MDNTLYLTPLVALTVTVRCGKVAFFSTISPNSHCCHPAPGDSATWAGNLAFWPIPVSLNQLATLTETVSELALTLTFKLPAVATFGSGRSTCRLTPPSPAVRPGCIFKSWHVREEFCPRARACVCRGGGGCVCCVLCVPVFHSVPLRVLHSSVYHTLPFLSLSLFFITLLNYLYNKK